MSLQAPAIFDSSADLVKPGALPAAGDGPEDPCELQTSGRQLVSTVEAPRLETTGRIWQLLFSLRLADASALIDEREEALPAHRPTAGRARLGMLRALEFALRDDIAAATSLAGDFHPLQTPIGRRVTLTLQRVECWRSNDYRRLRSLATPALRTGAPRPRDGLTTVLERSMMAAAEFDQLRFALAKRLALDAVAVADACCSSFVAASALPAAVAAQVYFEEGYLNEAEALIQPRLAAIARAGLADAAIRAYSTLGMIARQRGEPEFALRLLREAEALGARRQWRRLMGASMADQLPVLLLQGRHADAGGCLKRLECLARESQSGDPRVHLELQRHALRARSRVAIARGSSRRALVLLRQLRSEAARREDAYLGAQLDVELVVALAASGEQSTALEHLASLLTRGSAAGLFQSLVGAGPPLLRLLEIAHTHARREASPFADLIPYVESLLHSARIRLPGRGTAPSERRPVLLSVRESRILLLISRGLANKDVARSLGISPETVKSHAKHIFAKLEVDSRAAAVARAKGLNLI